MNDAIPRDRWSRPARRALGDLPPTRSVGGRMRGIAVACGVMAVVAAAGAVGLISGAVDLGPAVTGRLPGESAVLAALALAVVVALPMTLAAVAGWRRSPWASDLAVLAGLALVGWIVVQVAVILTFSWVQPVAAVYGLLVVGLGILADPEDGADARQAG